MRIAYLCLCLLLSGSILAQDGPVKSAKTKSQVPAASSSVPLPVSKVVLYKNGVEVYPTALPRIHPYGDGAQRMRTDIKGPGNSI